MKLRELGEDRLLAQLLPRLPRGKFATGRIRPFGGSVFVGAGDDCALVEAPARRNFLVLKTDCVVEGVHFLPRADPLDVIPGQ